jgi:aspartyl-tRNA(Asn)/glutamyl-tRNA(Gln) amidotransferase subunit A
MTESSEAGGLHRLAAVDLQALYARRQLSPVEVTKAIIDRIDSINPRVNAFAVLDPEAALADARASEERWRQGRPLSSIDGVPTTIKDTILAKGWPTLCGSLALEPGDDPWDTDAPSTARLREGGAILLGKTTMSEFGVSAVTESGRHGITRNPWNLDYSPGGSSGGAVVAAALGFGPMHVSSDGGGSTRVPASLTGVIGFMPSFGRIPQFPENYQGTRFHIGINTRSVKDAAILLSMLAQPDPRDWQALPPDRHNWAQGLEQGIKGLRIAFCPSLGSDPVDKTVGTVVNTGVQYLERLGATVELVAPTWTNHTACHRILGSVAMARLVASLHPERRKLIDPTIISRAEEASAIDAVTYVSALEQRASIGRQMLQFHQSFDLLVTPVTTFADLTVGGGGGARFSQTNLFNMTHQPACSVPCGLSPEGRPIGIQIVGAKYADAIVLRAAYALELANPFAQPPESWHQAENRPTP